MCADMFSEQHVLPYQNMNNLFSFIMFFLFLSENSFTHICVQSNKTQCLPSQTLPAILPSLDLLALAFVSLASASLWHNLISHFYLYPVFPNPWHLAFGTKSHRVVVGIYLYEMGHPFRNILRDQ